MLNLNGKVIRMCSSENCGIIYLDGGDNFSYIKTCKKCEGGTGFFETLQHFFRYIDFYGIDTDNIIDAGLKIEVCKHYGLEV